MGSGGRRHRRQGDRGLRPSAHRRWSDEHPGGILRPVRTRHCPRLAARQGTRRGAPVRAVPAPVAPVSPTPATAPTSSLTVIPEAKVPVPTSPTPAPPPVAASPVAASAPGSSALLSEAFGGSDGVFADQGAFWGAKDLRIGPEQHVVRGVRRGAASFRGRIHQLFRDAHVDAAYGPGLHQGRDGPPLQRVHEWSRELARRPDLWLNETLCTPAPGCSKVQDGPSAGPSGYALDFMNRDGKLTILKKVHGDTRADVAGCDELRQRRHVLPARWHAVGASGWRDVQVCRSSHRQRQRHSNTAGPHRRAGEVGSRRHRTSRGPAHPRAVGLRSDYADYTVDNISVTR